MKQRSRLKVLSLTLTWILFVSSVAFFLSYFPAQLPFFRIKKITVEGNTYTDIEVIRRTIEDLSLNLADFREGRILEELKRRTGGRVKKVFVSKKYTLEGVEIRLKIEERLPKAKVKVGKKYLLVDEEGYMFPPSKEDKLKDLPTIVSYGFSLSEKNLALLLRELEESKLNWKKLIINKDKIVLKTENNTKLILPPLEEIHPTLSDRLNMIYNFQGKEVDLRYGRFILVRE